MTINGVYELIYDYSNIESVFKSGDDINTNLYTGHMYQLLTAIEDLKTVKIVQKADKSWVIGAMIPDSVPNSGNTEWTELFKASEKFVRSKVKVFPNMIL